MKLKRVNLYWLYTASTVKISDYRSYDKIVSNREKTTSIGEREKGSLYYLVQFLLENGCIGCEGSLFSRLYNTKPVSFVLCGGGRFEAQLGTAADAATTTIFRIQEVKGNSVILQLIDYTGETPTCTTYTVILDLDCVCGIQCYSPILCTLCNEVNTNS